MGAAWKGVRGGTAKFDQVLDIVREDTVELKERFADKRRTSIEAGEAEAFEMADLIPEHEVVVTISHAGWVKRLPSDTYRTQGRGGKGVRGGNLRDEDYVEHLLTTTAHPHVLGCGGGQHSGHL